MLAMSWTQDVEDVMAVNTELLYRADIVTELVLPQATKPLEGKVLPSSTAWKLVSSQNESGTMPPCTVRECAA